MKDQYETRLARVIRPHKAHPVYTKASWWVLWAEPGFTIVLITAGMLGMAVCAYGTLAAFGLLPQWVP